MADRLFEVQRIYPSGKKAFVGTCQNTRLDTLGKMFGAGEYELSEVDRATNEPTSKPPLRRILHPGKYPLRPEFAKDPMDAEAEMNPPQLPAHVAALGATQLDSMTNAQIYDKAKNDALAEFQRLQEMQNLKDQLQRLENALQQRPQGELAGTSSMAQLREMMGLVKELMPPPIPNPLSMPLTPAESVRQGVESIRLFQSELKNLGLDMGGAQAKSENPALLKLIDALQSIATSALPALAAPRALPVQRQQVPSPTVLAGAHGQQPAPQAAAAPAPAPMQAPAPVEDPSATMLNELATKLRQDQAAQLAKPPRSHISETAAWINGRMADPAAGPIWANLPNVLASFSDQAIVQYIARQAPDLTDTQEKAGWLLSLVEILHAKKG